MRTTWLLFVLGLVPTACVKRIEPRPTGPTRALALLKETPERETLEWAERRPDLEVDTRDHERTPRVVTQQTLGPLRLDGARARLFGDEAATTGFAVDNFILLEVLDDRGKVLDRAVIGFTDPVMVGAERIDSVGPNSFRFGPGELDLTSRLPENAPFTLRATVLDYSGVGRVSDVFLVLDYPQPAPSPDDLRDQ